jgi:hypothetical protein
MGLWVVDNLLFSDKGEIGGIKSQKCVREYLVAMFGMVTSSFTYKAGILHQKL